MYWYYKYPFYFILLLLLFGIGYLVYTHLPKDLTENISEAVVPRDESGATDPDIPARENGAEGASSAVHPAVLRQLRSARKQFDSGSLLAARTLAQKALEMKGVARFGPAWKQAVDIISDVNTRLINGDAPCPEKVRYEVEAGDTLIEIAQAHNTTVPAIIRGNPELGGGSDKIFPGMIVHIYRADWRIEVVKEQYALLLFDGERLFKHYACAIGRQGRTPVGTFKVSSKIYEPDWTPPGKVIPYGSEENVLGTRWLGIVPTEDTDSTLKGYGIHGTWEPESIGTQASQGCIRMRNEEVEELYDIVPRGTPVIIKDQ
ncbi:MAG: L,D-transpeptidase family protein [Candidatus Pacebacteria bacterium]|nr:L,D-transpeptidase family protein [Candidatus Paceibacterota bacterium]